MSEQRKGITKEQVLVTTGTLLTSVGVDVAVHGNPAYVLAGLVGIYAAGKLTPEVIKYFVPGSDPQVAMKVVEQVANHYAPEGQEDLPQDAFSKVKRLLHIKTPALPGRPKDEREDGRPNARPGKLQPKDEPEVELYNPAIHRDHFYFGETLFPHANRILSGRKAIFGVSDAGKSNNIAVIWEELGRFGLQSEDLCIPLIYFDSEDEARGLCSKRYVRNPCWMDAQTLTVQNAFAFAQQIMNERLQVVINLQSYEDVDAALVMFYIIRGIQHWEEALPNEDRIPCEIILDEAAVWLPQSTNESSLSKAVVEDPEGQPNENGDIQSVSVLALLHRVFFSMVVRRGRKRGIGFTLATQRIAEIDKRALQANFLVLMRQTMTADFAVYKKYGIEANEAAALKPGQAYIFSSQETKALHQFRRRNSPSGAKTPGLENLRKTIKHPIEIEEEDAIEDIIAGMPDIDPDDSRYTTPTGIYRSPFYEQTTQYHYPVSSSPQRRELPTFYAQNKKVQPRENENVKTVKEPLEPDEIHESFNEKDETFTASHEDETAILMAVIDLQMANVKVTREAIKSKLKWNNAKHPVLKAICDKHKIAVR